MLRKIKSIFYNSKLKSEVLKSKGLLREMMNLEEAKKIGIIFNASKSKDIMTVTQFADNLRDSNKEVFILGYQNRKLDKDENDSRLFDKSCVNWYGVPTDTKITDFQKISLDILICAFEDECLPLEYMVAGSKAKFRVGAFSQSKTNYYELMINIKAKQELYYLLTQIKHFLKVINKNA